MAWQPERSASVAYSQRARRRARRRAYRPQLDALESRELLAAAPLLHIAPDGRHLFDASNQPYYLIGDTAWALPAGATLAQATSPETSVSSGFVLELRVKKLEILRGFPKNDG